MSMSRKKCCVPGCMTMDSGATSQTLHLFPNPSKYKARFNQWVASIGGDIIGLDDEDIYKHRSVCHAHFEEEYCCCYNRLSNIAVPTLNLPGPMSFPRFTFGERRPMREIQYCSIPVPSMSESLVTPSTSKFSTAQVKSSALTIEDNNESHDAKPQANTEAVVTPPEFEKTAPLEIKTGYPTRKGAPRIRKHMTSKEQRLHQKLIGMRIKLSKCRNNFKKQSASLKAAKNITTNPALLATLEKMPSTTKLLTMMQFRELTKRNKGRRFSLQEKILALSIFKQTPKGYRFLRKMLILPAPQTLAKLLSQANLEPGINKNIFEQIKRVSEKMKLEERLCVLLFDEMFLKANVHFNERRDKIIGFVTDGKETKPNFADHAQVYMVRGLLKNYKQPVCYTFSAAATTGRDIAIQLKEIISELQKAGLIVVATICDQGANRLALKLLTQESRGIYLKKGEEPRENIILINDQEVIPLYDPPHLLKCIRNNLLTKNLEYYINNLKCTAKWEHLILLHKENPGYKGVRLIPKLTDNHVLPEKLARNKMKVKFATQIFSRIVAANMGYLADKGILPKECTQTADLLVFFDNLFDSSNGSYGKRDARYAKPLLGPVTSKTIHHKEWAEAKKKLIAMKFVHPISGKVENVPTLKNWAWTLDGYEVLFKKLNKDFNVISMWMRHLNQDPLENFFGAIRSHGCQNTNPTPEKFEGAFTTLLINNISSAHAPTGANCEDDCAQNLYALIVSDNYKATSTSININLNTGIVIEDIKTKNDPRIIGALQYVSGYFIRNAKKKVFKKCKKCTKTTIAAEGTEYIKYREYAGRQWLCSPTESIVNSISAVQDIAYTVIKENLEKPNIKEVIKTFVIMLVDLEYIDCTEHKKKLIEYLINVTLRFFLYNYCKDVNKILYGKLDCHDDEDKFKVQAKKYYIKCCKRPLK